MLVRSVIQLAYGVIGIIAYILVFYAMFGVRRILSRNFIVIFALMSVSNIATWLNTWVYLKLRLESFFLFYYEFLQETPILANIHSFLANHFYYVQNIDLLLLTFDRFTAILSMGRDTKWWCKYYLYVAVFLHSAVFAFHLALRLPVSDQLRLRNHNGTYGISYEDLDNRSTLSLAVNMQLYFGIAVFLACSILNTLSLKLLRTLRKTRHSSTESSFFIISLFIFLSQFLNMFVAWVTTFFVRYGTIFGIGPEIMYELVYFTSDLFSIGPALMTVKNVVQISYGTPAMLSYGLVVWAMVAQRKKLSPSFKSISLVIAVTNILAWLNTWVYLKLVNDQPLFTFYYDNAFHFFISDSNYIQNGQLLLLTFDRYAAIAMFSMNLKWWEKYHKLIILAVHVLIIGIHLAIRLPMGNIVLLNNQTGQYILTRMEWDIFRNSLDGNVRLGFGIVTFFTCSILNILSIRTLRRLKKNKMTKLLRSFLLISMCIFITQAVSVSINCLTAIFNTFQLNTLLSIAYEILSYVSDLINMGPALYTILLPGIVRKFLIRKTKKALHMKEDDSQVVQPTANQANAVNHPTTVHH